MCCHVWWQLPSSPTKPSCQPLLPFLVSSDPGTYFKPYRINTAIDSPVFHATHRPGKARNIPIGHSTPLSSLTCKSLLSLRCEDPAICTSMHKSLLDVFSEALACLPFFGVLAPSPSGGSHYTAHAKLLQNNPTSSTFRTAPSFLKLAVSLRPFQT